MEHLWRYLELGASQRVIRCAVCEEHATALHEAA